MARAPRRLAAALFLLSAATASAQEEEDPAWTDYSALPLYELDPEGIVISRLENPDLLGDWSTDGTSFYDCDEPPVFPLSDARCSYGMEGRSVLASQAVMLTKGSHLFAVSSGLGVGSNDIYGWILPDDSAEFASTAVSLPSDNSIVSFQPGYYDAWGSSFYDAGTSVEMKLSDNVIVLPVTAHVFAAMDGTTPLSPYQNDDLLSEGMMMEYFDPGAVVLDHIAIANGGLWQQYNFERRGPSRSDTDLIWFQCDIQFSLRGYYQHYQDLELETNGVETDRCQPINDPPMCNIQDNGTRINEYMNDFFGPNWTTETGSIPILYTGDLPGDCAGGMTYAIACNNDDSCTGVNYEDYIAINTPAVFQQTNVLDRRKVVAHELGHLLGLKHPGEDPCPDIEYETDNLMIPGQPSADQDVLTPSQCEVARCVACKRLRILGLEGGSVACNSILESEACG